MYQATPKQHFKAQFMKKFSNTEAELKKSVAYKKKCVLIRCATRHFQGRGGFVKLGHFDKHLIKKSRKKFFLLDTLKTAF